LEEISGTMSRANLTHCRDCGCPARSQTAQHCQAADCPLKVPANAVEEVSIIHARGHEWFPDQVGYICRKCEVLVPSVELFQNPCNPAVHGAGVRLVHAGSGLNNLDHLCLR
jgi:hypothetical protein